ncbi:hypothetical protein CapIbe_001774 [Capra ibex]
MSLARQLQPTAGALAQAPHLLHLPARFEQRLQALWPLCSPTGLCLAWPEAESSGPGLGMSRGGLLGTGLCLAPPAEG